MQTEQDVKAGMRQWLVAVVLMVCVTLAFFDKISISVLFADPHFQDVMGIAHTDKSKLGWLMTSFLLAYGFSSVFLSFIGDLFNPKYLLMVTVASWGVLMGMMGFANSYEEMLFYRVLLGLAEGPLFALAYTIVKQTFGAGQQARASTMFLLGTPIGAALGFPITAYVLQSHDWQTTFYVLAALTLLVLVVIYFGLKGTKLAKQSSLAQGATRPSFKDHARNSKILLSSAAFWGVCLFNVALLTYLWGLNSWLPSYLMEAKHFDLKAFGQLSSLPFIAMLVGEVFGAFLSDRQPLRRTRQVMLGLFFAGAGLWLMVYVDSAMAVIGLMAFSAFSWGMSACAVFALLSRVSAANVAATAGGIFNGLGNFASAAAPVLIGYMVTMSGHFDYGIIFLAAVALVGSFILLPWLRKY
ncbi:MAG: MFS transporter [Neisseriaceae bacterium]|nr:MFS transporter [Neisseriaceae bacterium]